MFRTERAVLSAVAADFVGSAGFAEVGGVAAGGVAEAKRLAVMAKSRRKQNCFIVMHRKKSLPRGFAAAGKNTQLNIDLKRENANAKVTTRAKKTQKKTENV